MSTEARSAKVEAEYGVDGHGLRADALHPGYKLAAAGMIDRVLTAGGRAA